MFHTALDRSKESPTMLWPSSSSYIPPHRARARDQSCAFTRNQAPHSIPSSSYSKSWNLLPRYLYACLGRGCLLLNSPGTIGWIFGGRKYTDVGLNFCPCATEALNTDGIEVGPVEGHVPLFLTLLYSGSL